MEQPIVTLIKKKAKALSPGAATCIAISPLSVAEGTCICILYVLNMCYMNLSSKKVLIILGTLHVFTMIIAICA